MGTERRKEWMLHQFKYYASRHIRNEKYQLWTHENHAEELFSRNFVKQKLDYIHNNPVAARLADLTQYYVYSSAKDYFGEQGLLLVVPLDVAYNL